MAKSKNSSQPEVKSNPTSNSAPNSTEAPQTFEGSRQTLKLGSQQIEAQADWITLRKDSKALAHMFHVGYKVKSAKVSTRPLTFIFNGGPGAASAYLHVGALGPRRVEFGKQGEIQPPPAHLVENLESWTEFSDLVFVDPIGTGFSHTVDEKVTSKDETSKPQEPAKPNDEFWKINRDLDALGEFMQRYLTLHKRWSSPIFIAGESYGGFRVAKLARRLQENFDIGLNGVILISPALEMSGLSHSDYNLGAWIDAFPSMAAAAQFHGRSKGAESKASLSHDLGKAELFALEKLSKTLAAGDLIPSKESAQVYKEMSAMLGLPENLIATQKGRISFIHFARDLLKDQGLYCGIYDASITCRDPFPDRESYQGPDPTLFSIDRVFGAGINSLLSDVIPVKTDRRYCLLSMEVNSSWKMNQPKHVFELEIGATDDLRYGMSLNEHMKVMVVHGSYDLVTPYFASKRLIHLMKLPEKQRKEIQFHVYKGGHMFYSWEESRKSFFKDAKAFYKASTLK